MYVHLVRGTACTVLIFYVCGVTCCQVLTNAGHMYRVVLAYESDTDQLQTETYKLQLEVHMPNQLYTINTALNIGTVITLTSDIHLDR